MVCVHLKNCDTSYIHITKTTHTDPFCRLSDDGLSDDFLKEHYLHKGNLSTSAYCQLLMCQIINIIIVHRYHGPLIQDSITL